MRRAVFGGFSLAMGLFANTAAGQDARAARLGAPTALPDAPPAARAEAPPHDDAVTTAGLRSRIFGTPIAGTPMVGTPTAGGIVYGAPIPGTTTVQPPITPAPKAIGPGAPGVTEMRTPGGTRIPSVGPGGAYVVPGMEAPLYCEQPGMAAVGRVDNFSRWYTSGEYLMWWTRGTTLPPLITTSSPQFAGIPGLGDTRTVLGGGSFGETFHSGARLTIGRWLGDSECRGFEGRFWVINETNSNFATSTNQFPVLARPFFNVNTPFGPFSEVVSDPARGAGGIAVNLSHSAWGAEANYRKFLCGDPCRHHRIDAIFGYRYIGLKDELSITENFISNGINPPLIGGVPALVGVINDTFRTENHFHGGQIGLASQWNGARWSLDWRATVAFGSLTQIAEISGSQSLGLANGMVATFPGGLLALPGANMGKFTRNQFAVVPEVGVNIGYNLTQRLRVFVGYNFIYIGNALRPEGVIDTGVDVARIPNFPAGATTPLPFPRPTPQFHLSDYFVQGISFGLSYRW
jgi:putative beta barrel porin BBP7